MWTSPTGERDGALLSLSSEPTGIAKSNAIGEMRFPFTVTETVLCPNRRLDLT
jgi:hypothetical protein